MHFRKRKEKEGGRERERMCVTSIMVMDLISFPVLRVCASHSLKVRSFKKCSQSHTCNRC